MSTKSPRPGIGGGSAVRRLLRGAGSTPAFRESEQRRERYAVGLLSGYVAHSSRDER